MRIISVVRYLLLALFLQAVSAASFAQIGIGISVGFAPPPIPVYEQPICPSDGYIWTPGYWSWDAEGDDYYWVPGTWVEAPEVGFLWTPGYWGWGDGGYFFHEGYWGPHVGWYGGVNYGFGYFGHGYEGGRWDRDHFYYNRSVNNVNVNEIHNVYNTRIEYNNSNRVSYNGGNGGINERPSAQEEAYSRDRHIAPVATQNQHVQEARGNRELRASVNQGKPPIAATQRPGSFSGSNVVPAKEAGGRYQPPANRSANNNAARADNNANRPPNTGNNANRPPVTHAKDITPYEKPAPPTTGNPKLDQKYQQQQQKLYNNQNQQLQKLQQKQEQDHQRMAQQNASEAKKQQVEQQHQQQTQQLQQRHVQQQQQQQQKQQPQQKQQQPQHQPESKPSHP